MNARTAVFSARAAIISTPPVCGTGLIAHAARSPARTGHNVRCSRWQEIDWSGRETLETAPSVRRHEAGDVVLRSDEMQKYYEVPDRSIGRICGRPFATNPITALISGGKVRYVKANETLSFEARRGQTVAIVGESGCGKSTFAKVLMGLETATGGTLTLNNDEYRGHGGARPHAYGTAQLVADGLPEPQ